MRARFTIIGLVVLAATPAAAQVMIYDNSPRIIQVMPQGNSYGAVHAAPAASDDEIIERIERRKPQPRRLFSKPAAEPAPRPSAELPPPVSEPKRAELPPANEPRRTVLSAPPPATGAGSLTPVYPTPRWRNADPPPLPTNAN